MQADFITASRAGAVNTAPAKAALPPALAATAPGHDCLTGDAITAWATCTHDMAPGHARSGPSRATASFSVRPRGMVVRGLETVVVPPGIRLLQTPAQVSSAVGSGAETAQRQHAEAEAAAAGRHAECMYARQFMVDEALLMQARSAAAVGHLAPAGAAELLLRGLGNGQSAHPAAALRLAPAATAHSGLTLVQGVLKHSTEASLIATLPAPSPYAAASMAADVGVSTLGLLRCAASEAPALHASTLNVRQLALEAVPNPPGLLFEGKAEAGALQVPKLLPAVSPDAKPSPQWFQVSLEENLERSLMPA